MMPFSPTQMPDKQKPLWARQDLFSLAPTAGWGYVSQQQGAVAVESLLHLQLEVAADRSESITLVWTPDRAHLQVPESVPELYEALKQSRTESCQTALMEKNKQLRLFALLLVGFLAYESYLNWQYLAQQGVIEPLTRFALALGYVIKGGTLIFGVLLFFMFVLLPWMETRKRFREVSHWTVTTMLETADLATFEVWLARQRPRATRALMALIAFVGVVQLFHEDRLAAAALLKGDQSERWRLLTAPLMHGNFLHFFMNALGLMYLGRRIEALARWPQVPLVFFFSAWMGGEFSLLFGKGMSVGASGGLMGMLGFLLVFETMHQQLVPQRSRRRLSAAIVATAVMGIIGVQFIDNAAHIGGLLAGMLYAYVVFPRSETVIRPRSTWTDRIAALVAFGFLAYGALLAYRAMTISS